MSKASVRYQKKKKKIQKKSCKSDNMVVNAIKISQKMKNKS